MQEEKCSHQWTMTNVQTGFIITENCYKCDKTSTYFCLEEKPPLEEYREGDHFWNVIPIMSGGPTKVNTVRL